MQTLRVEDTDSRFEFAPDSAWKVQGSYHYSEAMFARFFILFRGTGINLYGQRGDGGAQLWLAVDGDWAVGSPLNLTGTSDGTKQIWNVTGLKDGEHQLHGLTTPQNGTVGNKIWIDYVELENVAGTGFDPREGGTNATNVPQKAVVVENADSAIQYTPSYQWTVTTAAQYSGSNLTGTNQTGTSFTFAFEGVAVWYYSDVGPQHAALTASIDGSPPERASGYSPAPLGLTRQLIWSKTSLLPARHTLTLTHAGQPGQIFNVDFIRVLRNEDSGVTSPAIAETSESGISQGGSNHTRLGLAIGVPLGVILLVGLTAFVMICLQRRRRTGFKHHSRITPMSQQPSAQGDSLVSLAPDNSTAPSTVPLEVSSAQIDQPQLGALHSDTLSSVGAPPPYRSPGPTSQY